MEELTDTRDLLASVEVKHSAEEQDGEAADKLDDPPRPDGTDSAVDAPRRRISQAVQVERVLQNAERSSHETLQVALAFDELREEMINNRVDTQELRTRLKEGISDPLKQIVEQRFTELLKQLKQLSGQLSNPEAAVSTQAATVAQIDTILVEMKQVLDKMLELETFNEVLDTLRQIIDAQEKVNDETRQQQKQKLRDLIE